MGPIHPVWPLLLSTRCGAIGDDIMMFQCWLCNILRIVAQVLLGGSLTTFRCVCRKLFFDLADRNAFRSNHLGVLGNSLSPGPPIATLGVVKYPCKAGWQAWPTRLSGKAGWHAWLTPLAGKAGWERWLASLASKLGGQAGRQLWLAWLGGKAAWQAWLATLAGKTP